MDQGYRFEAWFLRYWSRTTLPAAAVLLALSPFLLRGLGFAAFLVFFQLPVYMIHQYEEHAEGRFKQFANAMFGRGKEVLGDRAILWINIGGVWGVDLLALYAAFYYGAGWGLLAAYLPLVNGVSHVGMTLKKRVYNPGLWTSIVLFLPLGSYTVWRVEGSAVQHMVGLGLAMVIHLAIIAHVARNARQG
jgi:hypothetical protein